MKQNYFAILGIDPVFDIDLSLLEKAYFAEQRRYHPDRLIGKTATDRQKATLTSMELNQAYDALKNPLKRSQHLLSLHGIIVGTDHDTIKPSNALLMETMEIRELLMEADSIEHIEALEQQNNQDKQSTIHALSEKFQNQSLTEAAELSLKLGYLYKFDDEIRVKRKSLNPQTLTLT